MSTWEMVEHEPRDASPSPPLFIPLFPGAVGTPRNHPGVSPQYWHQGPDSDMILETKRSRCFFVPSLSCGTNQPKVSPLGQPVTVTPVISKKGEHHAPSSWSLRGGGLWSGRPCSEFLPLSSFSRLDVGQQNVRGNHRAHEADVEFLPLPMGSKWIEQFTGYPCLDSGARRPKF